MSNDDLTRYNRSIADARCLILEACGRFAWDWHGGDRSAVPLAVAHLFTLADRPLRKGGDVDGAYGAMVRDLAAHIRGLTGPDVLLSVVLATLADAYRAWRESARLRVATHRDPWLDMPESVARTIRSGYKRAGSGYPDGLGCDVPTHGSVGPTPGDPRMWIPSGGMYPRRSALIRRELHRESRPKRRQSVDVGGYGSAGGTYHARPYKVRKRKRK